MAARRYQDIYGQDTNGSWGRPVAPLASPDLVEYRRVSWSAVFAGVVVAISFNLVLAVLGIGIGLTTIDAAQAESPQASTLGLAATVWWIVTALLSLASGGWVAGRLAGPCVGAACRRVSRSDLKGAKLNAFIYFFRDRQGGRGLLPLRLARR